MASSAGVLDTLCSHNLWFAEANAEAVKRTIREVEFEDNAAAQASKGGLKGTMSQA